MKFRRYDFRKTIRTPGIYVQEVSLASPSVGEVASAVPAFIGYTEVAMKNGADLTLKPTAVKSLSEFETYFGQPYVDQIEVHVSDEQTGGFTVSSFQAPAPSYVLHSALRLFFANGGERCFIVSAGAYRDDGLVRLQDLMDGLAAAGREDEPTLLLVPDAVRLGVQDYETLTQAMLGQCSQLLDRFCILDVHDGTELLDTGRLAANRGYLGSSHLMHGAAYYPFLKTAFHFPVANDESNISVVHNGSSRIALAELQSSHNALYVFVKSELQRQTLVLPPSGAVAGVYVSTDRSRGVWKAPANVALSDVIEPVIAINDTLQDALNVDPVSGRSINSVRAFTGKGTLVWGARTLAGNSIEWRYVPVRRFCTMVGESIQKSIKPMVFEPNDANTWTKVCNMIETYLTSKFRDGALQGATIDDAFFVQCGLGTTMTAQDVQDGRLIAEVGLAVVRPAEFIVLRFELRMLK